MTINKVSNSFRNSLLPHYCVFSPCPHETCTGPTSPGCAVVALRERPYAVTASSSLPRPPCHRHLPLPTLSTATSQPGSATTLLDRHVTPSVPLPSLRDVGIPIPPKRPRHNNDDNATSSSMPTPTTMPCRRPHHRLNAPLANMRERGGGSEVTRGSEIPIAALVMPTPYYKPICVGGPQRRAARSLPLPSLCAYPTTTPFA
jgi:hypothetical protein